MQPKTSASIFLSEKGSRYFKINGLAKIISQDEIIPKKLRNYLMRHEEITKKLSKTKKIKILLTDKTKNIEILTKKWFGSKIKSKLINL